MPHRRDPAKQIIAVAVGLESGRKKIVLLNSSRTPLVMEWEGLTLEEAEVYADGVQYGLSSMQSSAIKLFREGKLKIDVEFVAGASSDEEAALFRDGVIAGIDLRSRGYWLSGDDSKVQMLH